MTHCAFLLEVVVGELTLTHHHRRVISPTVCIQVSGGPPLLVPFLTPAFSSTIGHPRTEDGHFVFQHGKSSIFSAPRQLLGGGEARVRVEVLAGGRGGVQETLLGRCDALMTPQGEASIHLALRGKLGLVGRDGEAVGFISLSISLRCVGEEVTGDWGLAVGDWRSYKTPGIRGTYEESFSVLQDGCAASPHSPVPYHDLPASEKIALRIASLQDPTEAAQGEWQPVQYPRDEIGVGLAQPPPILYLGRDEEGERLWEEKVAKMNQNEVTQTQEHQENERKEAKERKDDQDTTQGSPRSPKNNTHTPTQHPKRKRKTRNPHHPPKPIHRQPMKKQEHPSTPLARPRGWLRSTPPAPAAPTQPPRLNRSHLLRLAALNPQLGRDLRAEVERRVKNRVKDLETDFLEQLEKLEAKRRSRRVSRQTAAATNTTFRALETVGCQTESAEVTSPVPQDRRIDERAVQASPSPSPPFHHYKVYPHHHSHHASPPQTILYPPSPPPPHHTTTTTTKAISTQTETTRITTTDSPKERKEERRPDKQRMKEKEKEPVLNLATELRVPGESQGAAARVRLGDMPKNLTYVIGSDGERVYEGGYEVPLQKEEGEERGERLGEGREGKELGERTQGEGTLKNEKNDEKNKRHSHTPSYSSFSKPQRETAPSPAPLARPQPQPRHYLGEEKEQPLREPSQDTWGLTYTIRAADQDPSTSTQQKSTPSTCLSTPYTESGGGGGGSESWASSEVDEEVEDEEEVEEEVPSASSLSNEVCREIFKGRKADILSGMASSPVQSIGESLLSASGSEADSEQARAGYGYSSTSHTPTPQSLVQKGEEKPKRKDRPQEKQRYQESYVYLQEENEGRPKRRDKPQEKQRYQRSSIYLQEENEGRPKKRDEPLGKQRYQESYVYLQEENEDRPQEKQRNHHKEMYLHDSHRNTNSRNTKGITQDPTNPSLSPINPRDSASGSSGTSISDISARIAALLVAKKIDVPRLNTDSVSSYVPSQQPSTLSSMSDILMSPSSSFSG